MDAEVGVGYFDGVSRMMSFLSDRLLMPNYPQVDKLTIIRWLLVMNSYAVPVPVRRAVKHRITDVEYLFKALAGAFHNFIHSVQPPTVPLQSREAKDSGYERYRIPELKRGVDFIIYLLAIWKDGQLQQWDGQ